MEYNGQNQRHYQTRNQNFRQSNNHSKDIAILSGGPSWPKGYVRGRVEFRKGDPFADDHRNLNRGKLGPEEVSDADPRPYVTPDICYLSGPPTSYANQIMDSGSVAYFIIRSYTLYNIEVSMKYNLWATPWRNEVKFQKALRENKYVVLIYRMNNATYWSGYGIMRNDPGDGAHPSNVFVNRSGSPFYGNCFDVEWIRKIPLPVSDTKHLTNAFNRNLTLERSMDGQVLDPETGRRLCLLFERKWLAEGGPTHVVAPSTHEPPSFLYRNLRSAVPHPPPNTNALNCPPDPPFVYGEGLRCQGSNRGQVGGSAYESVLAQSVMDAQRSFKSTSVDAAVLDKSKTANMCVSMPALALFPIDLTSMTYDEYLQAYLKSQSLWNLVIQVQKRIALGQETPTLNVENSIASPQQEVQTLTPEEVPAVACKQEH